MPERKGGYHVDGIGESQPSNRKGGARNVGVWIVHEPVKESGAKNLCQECRKDGFDGSSQDFPVVEMEKIPEG